MPLGFITTQSSVIPVGLYFTSCYSGVSIAEVAMSRRKRLRRPCDVLDWVRAIQTQSYFVSPIN
jgi:hypothetical protein